MHILLIEDDLKLGPLLHYKLSQAYHTVDWVSDTDFVEEYLQKSSYDLYILDWMMPKKSGLDICQDIRKRKDTTPILMLTARDSLSDRVLGLNTGADDYLVKPFAFEELFARVNALGRRVSAVFQDEIYEFGDLTVNPHTHEVKRGDVSLSLTKKEFQLILFLVRHAEQTLSRDQILDHVWGVGTVITPNAVDAAIKLLRKKVDNGFEKKIIQSIRGIGYRLSYQQENPHV
ncbi:MAG: response regulator transcription factor [Clostridia bacterium]